MQGKQAREDKEARCPVDLGNGDWRLVIGEPLSSE